MAKKQKNALVEIRCYHINRRGQPPSMCKAKTIVTNFHNTAIRFLCPKCGKVDFYTQGENGIERLIGYTHFES